MFVEVKKISQKIIKSLNKRKYFALSFYRVIFLKKEETPGILFVMSLYLTAGGVEKRIKQYAAVWKKRGYKTYVAAIQKEKSSQKEDLFLGGNKILKNILLKIFIHKKNIKVVEWNAGIEGIPFDLEKLKKEKIYVGAVIHAVLKSWNYSYLTKLDYVFCASSVMGKRVVELKDYLVLPNALSLTPPAWSFCSQKKALLISRLSPEKVPSIESFIKFCLSRNLFFEIAGDVWNESSQRIKIFLKGKYNLEDSVFLGEINTLSYLKEHVADYLFVGGVGQVILEAGMLGYPCLLCSLCGFEKSLFITEENFLKAYEVNFSPHSLEETALLLDSASHLFQDFSLLISGRVNKFILSKKIEKNCNITKILELYEKNVFEKIK